MKLNISMFICAAVLFVSCKKLIEVGTPPSELTTADVFSDSATAIAALDNIYSLFDQGISGNYDPAISCYTDEMYTGATPDLTEFSNSAVSAANGTNLNIWRNFYAVIYGS